MSGHQFTHIQTTHTRQHIWLHASGTRWVTGYEPIGDRTQTFRAYRAIEHVPKGRLPWTVDNRHIGGSYRTLDAALTAVLECRAES